MMLYPMITESTKNLPIYLTGIGRMSFEAIERPKGYNYCQILIVTKGKCEVFFNNKNFILNVGDGLCFRRGVAHKYFSITENFEDCWVAFTGEYEDKILNLLTLSPIQTFCVENFSKQISLFERLENETLKADAFYDEKLSSLLYSYIIETARNQSSHFIGQKKERFLPVLKYIENNFDTVIELDDLCKILKLSKFRFCNSFKEVFGISPINYLIMYRIQMSKKYLYEDRNMTIAEISKKVGFNDISYFCSIFKKYEKLTPTEFRNF